MLLLVVAVFFPSLFTPYTPEQMDFSAILQPPDLRHWFGTDQLGRDVFTRVVYGTSLSLSIGVGATLIASAGGIVLGTLAGLAPRAVRQLLVRLLDIMLAFPDLLLALLAITGVGAWAREYPAGGRTGRHCWLCQAGARASVAGRGYRGMCSMRWRWESRHGDYFAPYCAQYAAPAAGTGNGGIGYSILSASALSFLGLGVTPPTAEWGALLSEGRNFLDSAPWVSLLPASVVALSVIAITLLGRRVQTLIAKGGIA